MIGNVRRRVAGALVAVAVLLAATAAVPAGADTYEQVIHAESGSVSVTANVRVTQTRSQNESVYVVDVFYEHNGSALTFGSGTVSLVSPDGTTYKTPSLGVVNGARQRARTNVTSGSPTGGYTVQVRSTVTVTPADGSTPVTLALASPESIVVDVRRQPKAFLDVAPESVPEGQPVWVSGTLLIPDRAPTLTWSHLIAGAGEQVELFFDPAGDAPRVSQGRLTTDADGFFSGTFTASSSGTWSVEFAGTATEAPTSAQADMTVQPVTSPFQSAVTTTRTDLGTDVSVRVIAPREVGLKPGITTFPVEVAYLFPNFPWGNAGVAISPPTPVAGISNEKWAKWQEWDEQTAHGDFYLDARYPLGTYALSLDSRGALEHGHFEDSEDDQAAEDYYFSLADTVLRIRVGLATRTSIKVTAPSEPALGVTVTGTVVKTVRVSDRLEERAAAGAAVQISFDPSGPAGPTVVQTVTADARGAFRCGCRPSAGSGTWIATYQPGGELVSSSARAASTFTPLVTAPREVPGIRHTREWFNQP